jgi:hypothetical protein
MSRVEIQRMDRIGPLLSNYVVWWIFFTLIFATVAASLGSDGTPDFKIYHFYNGFAAHHDRSSLDIIPAQMQTAFFNKVDAVYYSLFTALNDWPRLLNVLLSVPYSAAAFAVYAIGRLCLEASFYWRNLACAAAAIFGLTGASALPTLATTMTDIVPGTPFLFALLVWLAFEKHDRNTAWTAFIVGLIAGFSIGLKLTLAPLFVGLLLAIAVRSVLGGQSAVWEAFAFGGAGVVAFTAIDISWLLANYRTYGNPIFPLMNAVFKSDLVAPWPWTDLRFMPKTVLMALFYPAYWAFRPSHDAIELNMRDPRIMLGCISAIIILLVFVLRRLRSSAGPQLKSAEILGFTLAILFLTSYVLWERVWSIYRYLAVQESLSGVMMLVALTMTVGTRLKSRWVFGLFTLIVVWAMRTTEYPWWSRAQRAPHAIEVTLPPMEPNAMVLFLDPYAYSYLVPFMPSTIRAIGANTNLVRPGSPGKLQERITATIRDHQGPLWGMEYPEAFMGVADSSLRSYQLIRDGECTLLDTNIEDARFVKICRLGRVSSGS